MRNMGKGARKMENGRRGGEWVDSSAFRTGSYRRDSVRYYPKMTKDEGIPKSEWQMMFACLVSRFTLIHSQVFVIRHFDRVR